jgi:hypothetical protein
VVKTKDFWELIKVKKLLLFHLLGQKTKNSAFNSLISDHFWAQRPNFWQVGKIGIGESRDESGDRESMGVGCTGRTHKR